MYFNWIASPDLEFTITHKGVLIGIISGGYLENLSLVYFILFIFNSVANLTQRKQSVNRIEKGTEQGVYVHGYPVKLGNSAGIFEQSMKAWNRAIGTGLSYLPARLYTAWRNWFLGIDSWAP